VQRNGVWRNAVSLWEDTVAKSPGNSRVWGNLGAAYTNNGEYEKGVTMYQKAIALDPHYETALLNLAAALNGLHRSQEALEALASLEKLNPALIHSPDVLCARSVALIESGKVDEGVQLLNTIVAQVPSHRMSHVVLGMIYSQTNHPGKAVEHYQRALQLQPVDPTVRDLMQKAELAVNSR
jgi:tetratricopeptide (TPR) repeat protein